MMPQDRGPGPQSVADLFGTTLTAEEVVGYRPTEQEIIDAVRRIPWDWGIEVVSRLNRVVERSDGYTRERQLTFVRDIAPPNARQPLASFVSAGRFFVHEEQLHALARLLLEYGGEPRRRGASGVEAFFWALLGTNDLLGIEGNPGKDEAAQTSFLLQTIASQPRRHAWNSLARAHAYWFGIPALLAGTPGYQDVRALFRDATSGVSLSAYHALLVAAFAKTEGIVGRAVSGTEPTFPNWALNPAVLLQQAPDQDAVAKAWSLASAGRDWYRDQFREQTRRFGPPKYRTPAMIPLRQRPIVQLAPDRCVVLSARFAFDAMLSGVFWTIADYLSPRGQRGAFTDFVGGVHERYVVELLRSARDADGGKRVFSDGEAIHRTKERRSTADALVLNDDHVLLAEATITWLNYNQTVRAGDLTAFERDIRMGPADKVRQLERARAALLVGEVAYPGFDADQARAADFVPLVILRDALPLTYLVTRKVAQILASEAVGQSDPRPYLISVDEFEMALRRADPGRVRRLLAEWRADPVLWEERFGTFYVARYPADGTTDVEFLNRCYDEAWAAITGWLGIEPPSFKAAERESTSEY